MSQDNNKLISYNEVQKHNSAQDCWVIIHGQVYDLTSFLQEHPGGAGVIVAQAGTDATAAFDPIHPKDILRILPPQLLLGRLDTSSVPSHAHADTTSNPSSQATTTTPAPATFAQGTGKAPETSTSTSNNQHTTVVPFVKPALEQMLNLFDFEAVAQQVMKKEAWDYYSSGADDEITLRENHAAFHRIWFRPRVLVNVEKIDMSTSILGFQSSMPLYISATALGKLGHPEGEVVLTRAAGVENIIQMCPTLASCSLEDMTSARTPQQTQFFQLYVNKNRDMTLQLVRKAEQLGCKALFITVDAPQLGRRERDMRNKFTANAPAVQKGNEMKRNAGVARAISTFIDPSLSWDDIKWFQSITKLPIILKGIQCGEDAVIAAQLGVSGIVVSNHGGRQLDFARSGIEALVEVMEHLRSHQLQDRVQVFVDGGIRRGTDIFKALALGARAVGVGRPMLYAMSSYGQEGVEHAIRLLKDELTIVMRLMGTPTIQHIKANMCDIRGLSQHLVPTPADWLQQSNYSPLPSPLVNSRSRL